MPKTKLLNQARLAACLGVDRGTIWRWHVEGKEPPRVLIRKRYYYDLDAVRRWLQRGTVRGHRRYGARKSLAR